MSSVERKVKKMPPAPIKQDPVLVDPAHHDPSDQLPSQTQKVIPHWLQAGGALLLGLPYMYSKLDGSDLGGNADWAALAGAVAVVGGIVLNWGKDKQATAAVNSAKTATSVAKSAPPLDPDGRVDPHLTLSYAVQQLLAAKTVETNVLANEITGILVKIEKDKQ